MNKVLFYCSLLVLGACSSREPNNTDVLALIGDDKITVQDFKIAYELFPAFKTTSGKSINQKKIEQLNAMIADKIFAKVAQEKKVQNEERVKILLRWYKNRAVVRQLYRDEIKEKIKVSESDVRIGFDHLNERLLLRKLDFQTKEQAQKAYALIKDGKGFQEVAKSYTESEEALKHILTPREFSWGDLDERLENAAYQLNQNEISEPVETDNGFHLVQMVNKKVQLIVTENAFQDRRHYIETIIRRRRESRLAKSYVNKIMEKISPQLKFEVLKKMVNSGKKAFLEIDNKSVPVYLQPGLIKPYISDLMNETLIRLNEGSWTVADLFEKIDKLHPKARFDLLDISKLPVNLSVMIRDEALAKEGYKKKLESDPQVLSDFSRKQEETLALYMRKTLQDTVKINEGEILKYYTEQKAKYGQPEKVNIREVMVYDKSLADSLHILVENGADISVIAKKFSVRKWAAEKSGDMGYFAQGAFGSVGDAAFNTKLNVLSAVIPILLNEITVGYSFFRVLDKKESIDPEYSMILDQVSKDALKAKREKIISNFYEKNRARFAVTANYDLLEKVKTIDALNPSKAMEFRLKEQF